MLTSQDEGYTMVDYGKSGTPKIGKNSPRHYDHKGKAERAAEAQRNAKAEVLAKLKAAAEAKKQEPSK